MRDMLIIGGILSYFLILGLVLSTVFSDSALTGLSGDTNTSFKYPIAYNSSEVPSATGGLNAFISAIQVMFGFSTPHSNFPSIISLFISTVDWIVFIIGGVVTFRVLIHGGQ